MRIKTQFIVTMVLFSLILIMAAASAIITHQLAQKVGKQERIAAGIAQGAGELGYLSNDYLIYRESQQLKRWQSRFAAFSGQVAALNVENPELQALAANIRANENRMKAVFDSVSSAPVRGSQDQDTAFDPAFLKISWSRMAVQSQALATDALRLSQLLDQQREQLTDTRTILMYLIVGLFGLFLLASYLLTYRRILKSIVALRSSAAVIGSGNLDHTIAERKNDEIGELSQAFNRMTRDLKAVTASKADLEREIDERKRAEEELYRQREWFRVTLASIGDAVIATDTEGRIIFLNAVTETLTGWTLPEAAQKPVQDVFHIINEESRGAVENPVARVFREGVIVGLANHTLLVRRDGTEVPIDDSAAPIRDTDGRIVGAVLIFRDITERRQTERSQAEHAAQLEELNTELESFSYSVSHDLRAPLRAINGYVQMILKKAGEGFDAETRRRFQSIKDNVETMGQLIDDLLAFSRLGRQTVAKRSLDMEELIGEVWQELLTINPGREIVLKIGCMPAAAGDRTLIRQAYGNLLGNAVKFTQGRDKALIEAGSYVQNNEAVYYIRDNGIGFDMKFYDKLFGAFQRLHSDEEYKGTGIGLALVQRIVHRHGGRVWAEGKVDEGACFYFTLPEKS